MGELWTDKDYHVAIMPDGLAIASQLLVLAAEETIDWDRRFDALLKAIDILDWNWQVGMEKDWAEAWVAEVMKKLLEN